MENNIALTLKEIASHSINLDKQLNAMNVEHANKLLNSTDHLAEQAIDNHLEMINLIMSDKEDSIFKLINQFGVVL